MDEQTSVPSNKEFHYYLEATGWHYCSAEELMSAVHRLAKQVVQLDGEIVVLQKAADEARQAEYAWQAKVYHEVIVTPADLRDLLAGQESAREAARSAQGRLTAAQRARAEGMERLGAMLCAAPMALWRIPTLDGVIELRACANRTCYMEFSPYEQEVARGA
jgi:alkyl sulfatase BDS1-like metallo-beta-lactamase superfamily hydrolase